MILELLRLSFLSCWERFISIFSSGFSSILTAGEPARVVRIMVELLQRVILAALLVWLSSDVIVFSDCLWNKIMAYSIRAPEIESLELASYIVL